VLCEQTGKVSSSILAPIALVILGFDGLFAALADPKVSGS
jgi:hypothetical protein